MQKRKRLSRLAAICLSGAVLLQSSVFAADITVRQDGNKVTVTHDTESGANGTFMYVFDTKLEEGAEITAVFVKQHLLHSLTHLSNHLKLKYPLVYKAL